MQEQLMQLASELEMDFSFQLDNMYNFRANIAVLMNITPDHLDRYDHCMQKYVDAKFRITQNQTPEDAFIFWNDDPIIKRELDKHGLRAHLYPFAAVKEDGAIAYVEDGEVEINEPIAFNYGARGAGAARHTQPIQFVSRRHLGQFGRHPERIYPQSLVRLQGSGTPVGESSHRTRRELHQRFQGNERKLLLVCPAKHDRQNRTYPRW